MHQGLHRAAVLEMLRQGKPLAQIEEEIEDMPISEDAKAWLWLIAYSDPPQPERESVRDVVVPLG
jgi:hypothetical protein